MLAAKRTGSRYLEPTLGCILSQSSAAAESQWAMVYTGLLSQARTRCQVGKAVLLAQRLPHSSNSRRLRPQVRTRTSHSNKDREEAADSNNNTPWEANKTKAEQGSRTKTTHQGWSFKISPLRTAMYRWLATRTPTLSFRELVMLARFLDRTIQDKTWTRGFSKTRIEHISCSSSSNSNNRWIEYVEEQEALRTRVLYQLDITMHQETPTTAISAWASRVRANREGPMLFQVHLVKWTPRRRDLQMEPSSIEDD